MQTADELLIHGFEEHLRCFEPFGEELRRPSANASPAPSQDDSLKEEQGSLGLL